jgi:hypothetical protein
VPLSLVKVGILGYLGKSVIPLVRQLGREGLTGGFGFFSCFPWSYGLSVRSGSSEVV